MILTTRLPEKYFLNKLLIMIITSGFLHILTLILALVRNHISNVKRKLNVKGSPAASHKIEVEFLQLILLQMPESRY
ncbi:helix-turn-helix transcriptional regulator [Paenibacillus sp. PK3_47]|nr:helix-turn-helix transcriptional regulator [Paenibacillus sp. PK3_47]